jgi:hypothetical protein
MKAYSWINAIGWAGAVVSLSSNYALSVTGSVVTILFLGTALYIDATKRKGGK